MFQKRVVRKISGPKGNIVTGRWRKVHEELHNFTPRYALFRSSNKGGWDG
jgi:hypothetical protein